MRKDELKQISPCPIIIPKISIKTVLWKSSEPTANLARDLTIPTYDEDNQIEKTRSSARLIDDQNHSILV